MNYVTESAEFKAALKRLSKVASDGLTEYCAVARSDLATLLTAFPKGTKKSGPQVFSAENLAVKVGKPVPEEMPPSGVKGFLADLEPDENGFTPWNVTIIRTEYDPLNPIVEEEDLAFQKKMEEFEKML